MLAFFMEFEISLGILGSLFALAVLSDVIPTCCFYHDKIEMITMFPADGKILVETVLPLLLCQVYQ